MRGIYKNPEERSKKISEAHKKRGTKPPYQLGFKMSEESKRKLSEMRKGAKNHNFGKAISNEIRLKISLSKIGKPAWNKGLKGITQAWNKGKKLPQFSGVNHPNWIKDRSKLAMKQQRNDSAYKNWRMSVWIRDSFKCKIANDDCSGRLEAHHILVWRLYPELRYEINNGISLCHAHHPKVRAEEKRLAPIFQELVSVSKG